MKMALVLLSIIMMINHESYIEISFLRYSSTHLCNQNQKQLSRARDFAKRVSSSVMIGRGDPGCDIACH